MNYFGKPISTDSQSEYWLSASSYLSYGGILRVVRTDSSTTGALNNANSTTTGVTTSIKIKSYEDYVNNYSNSTNWAVAAKNPGSWGNNLKVCVIDAAADQIISGISTGSSSFSQLFTSSATIAANASIITGVTTNGTPAAAVGQYIQTIPGIINSNTQVTAIGIGSVYISTPSINSIPVTTTIGFGTFVASSETIQVGCAFTVGINTSLGGVGAVTTETGYLKGIVTGIGVSTITVKVVSRYRNSTADFVSASYAANTINAINSGTITILNTSGNLLTTFANYVASDWYNQQTLGLTNATVYWSSLAPKPGTSQYTSQRNGKNDEIHVVVVDDNGSITGNAGNVIEKFVGLSKATDAKVTPAQPIYFDDYIASNSNYIFIGFLENGNSTGFTTASGSTGTTGNLNTNAQGIVFSGFGAKTYTLTGGTDYTNGVGSYAAPISNIISSYNLFSNIVEYPINFLINGPSSGANIFESQSKANALIAIAENRKDCIAVVSPHKSEVVNITSSDAQTTNIVKFFSPLTSSSYTVFDSGYKYTFDRFNNQFVYLACNADIAGLMAKTSINQYPWFSPAGAARGAINNAVKLAYNPSQSQRDLLYTNRINPIIASPGQGIILFGDKTALGYSSAFDRINVRRLFLTLESTIERAARAQLFEFNDAITRSSFVNIVEPYLRDVKSKRGITDFLLVCDETNNTPDVIDSNRFRADIFVKPARSINFIGLTFVATRTGISFSEVVGTV